MFELSLGRYPGLIEKGSGTAGALSNQYRIDAYCSAPETLVKVDVNLVPRPCTTTMMATEMPAAMRPYSMAVAPDSSRTKRLKRFMSNSLIHCGCLSRSRPMLSGHFDRAQSIVRDYCNDVNPIDELRPYSRS